MTRRTSRNVGPKRKRMGEEGGSGIITVSSVQVGRRDGGREQAGGTKKEKREREAGTVGAGMGMWRARGILSDRAEQFYVDSIHHHTCASRSLTGRWMDGFLSL